MPRRALVSLATLAAATSLALAGCQTTASPTETIWNAELALRKAEEADAQHHAALEMRVARERLEGAKRALSAEENVQARRLAEQSLVEAQLAEAKASTARSVANAREVRANIDALRQESERAAERLR